MISRTKYQMVYDAYNETESDSKPLEKGEE